MTRLTASLVFGALALAVQQSPAMAEGTTVAMTVEANHPGATIDRHIFGQFAEHLGHGIYGGIWVGKNSRIPNVRGIRTDVVDALKAIHVPDVRWPGGCFADEYHWRDGVGPQSQRVATTNSNWGNAPEPNSFGTDEYMDFIHQIGADAYVSLNLGSGTVKEAADWLAYMTAPVTTTAGKERAANGHPKPYVVKYVGLGNESWSCGGDMTPTYYANRMKRFARFVNNYNPAQRPGSPEAMQMIAVGPGDKKTETYTTQVMKSWSKHDYSWDIHGLSLHSYTTGGWPPSMPSTGFGEGDYAKLVKDTLKMNGFLNQNEAIMDKFDPKKQVSMVVDEWGVWLAPTPGTNPGFLMQQNSLRDAIIAALNINIFARHADRVHMANIAQMVNVLQSMLMTKGPQMVKTPTYYIFKMYVPFQNATFIPLQFDPGTYSYDGVDLPRVDAIAAKGKGGHLWLAVTNLDPHKTATISATIDGARAGTVTGQVLTAPNVNSVNTFSRPNTVVPAPISGTVSGSRVSLTLPARSVAVVRLN